MTRGATTGRRPRAARKDPARRRALEGLRDALSLMMTRVIEDEVSADEARGMLAYLKKEVDAIDRRAGGARRPRGARRRRKRAGARAGKRR